MAIKRIFFICVVLLRSLFIGVEATPMPIPASAHFWDKCSTANPHEGHQQVIIAPDATGRETESGKSLASAGDGDELSTKIQDISCTGFRDENNGLGLHYIGHFLNAKPRSVDHIFTKHKDLTYGVKVTHPGSKKSAQILKLAGSQEFQRKLKAALGDQLGWMYLDSLTYFGDSTVLANKYEIEKASGALAFQYGATCKLTLSGGQEKIGFRFESAELVFYMPPYGKCEPKDGFLPIVNATTNSCRYENPGADVLDVKMTLYPHLTWKGAPPAKFQDVYMASKRSSHIPINYGHPSAIMKRFIDAFGTKMSSRTGLKLRFSPEVFGRIPEEEVEHIAPGTAGYLYEHVLQCGDYTVFTALVHQRTYSLESGACMNLGPDAQPKKQLGVLELCEVCPDLNLNPNNCEEGIIFPGITQAHEMQWGSQFS